MSVAQSWPDTAASTLTVGGCVGVQTYRVLGCPAEQAGVMVNRSGLIVDVGHVPC